MRTLLRMLAVATAALVLVSGCSVASTPDAASPGSTVDVEGQPFDAEEQVDMEGERGNAAAWCALVPPSLIASTLGMDLREPAASFSKEEVHCTYPPVEDGGLTIQVMFRLAQDHDRFVSFRSESEIPGVDTTDLAGVGDEAYYSSSEFGDVTTHTITARKGSVVLVVGAPTELDGVEDLVNEVFAQLG